MASQTRTYDKKKLLGQIYTPQHIVEKILEDTGFYQLDFCINKILDPACGDGRFLIPIAQYIIKNSSPENLKHNLENIYGWDIDQNALDLCRQNLNNLIAHLDIDIHWKLLNINALEQNNSLEKFDLIIGNPPYIRIQHLPVSQRQYVQSVYSFCRSGSTDAYIAFFQLASQLLSENGICGFITPNSFLTSGTAKLLRSYFSQNQNLMQITNFGSIKIFGNTGTYAAITIFGKKSWEHFRYETSNNDFRYEERNVLYSELSNDQWSLSLAKTKFLDGTKLSEICQISVGITTLSDSLYLFKIQKRIENLVQVVNKNGITVWLEFNILKPIIKGSKLRSSSDPIMEYILFPYEKDSNEKHRIIREENLKANFPKTYQYLCEVKDELNKRDNGKPNSVAWYAFGRSQGLDSSFGKKIIFSPMNRYPNFVLHENPDCTVYSGYFLKYDGDYEFLLSQLNSQRMADFIQVAGRDFRGGYKGYNKKALENFIITDFQ